MLSLFSSCRHSVFFKFIIHFSFERPYISINSNAKQWHPNWGFSHLFFFLLLLLLLFIFSLSPSLHFSLNYFRSATFTCECVNFSFLNCCCCCCLSHFGFQFRNGKLPNGYTMETHKYYLQCVILFIFLTLFLFYWNKIEMSRHRFLSNKLWYIYF